MSRKELNIILWRLLNSTYILLGVYFFSKTKTDLVLISGHLLASSVVNTAEEEVQENVRHGSECQVKSTKYNVIACPVCQALKQRNCPAFPQTIIPVQKWKRIYRMSFVKTTQSK